MEPANCILWELLSLDPVFAGHRVGGQGVFPAAGYLEMAQCEWAHPSTTSGAVGWKQVLWMHPLLGGRKQGGLSLTMRRRNADGLFEVRIGTDESGLLCRGQVTVQHERFSTLDALTLGDVRERSRQHFSEEEIYQRFDDAGISYSKGFRVLRDYWETSHGGIARVRMDVSGAGLEIDARHARMCRLDGLMQTALAGVVSGAPMVPFSMEELILWKELPDEFYVEATLIEKGSRGAFFRFGLRVYDLDGVCIGQAMDLCVKAFVVPEPRKNRVAIASTFTAEPVEPALKFWLDRAAFSHVIHFAPYDQLHQELLNPSSVLSQEGPGCNIVMLRLQDLQRRVTEERDPVRASATRADGLDRNGSANGTGAGNGETSSVQGRHVLPNGMEVSHLNPYETDYLYHEIFVEQTYLKHGIEVREGDTVIDIGANIGMFSLFLASRLERVRIFSLEPSPVTFGLLEENAARHGVGKIFPVNAGAGGECRAAQFTFYPRSSVFSGFHAEASEDGAALRRIVERAFAARGLPEEATREYVDAMMRDRLERQTFECRLVTVASVLEAHGIECVDLLKVDAEKCETEILRAMTPEVWAKIRQVVVETHEGEGNQRDEIVALLESKGFDVAVEEEMLLGESGLYNLYARRPDAGGVADSKGALHAEIEGRARPCILGIACGRRC